MLQRVGTADICALPIKVTIYVPVRLWLTTKACLPNVERFSELGRPRNETELEHEYQRLLARDRNPVSFLYNGALSALSSSPSTLSLPPAEFRRRWGTYKSLYLIIKFVALLTVALIDPNNCKLASVLTHFILSALIGLNASGLFRNYPRTTVTIIRQAVLLAVMTGALIMQSLLTPFIDPVSNASEWTSRANYVSTALLGLLVALFPNTNDVLMGPVLYV